MKRLAIGSLKLSGFAILSPLEGVSDVGFRALCAANGAGITWTEMVRAQAINKNNGASLDLIDTFDSKTPTGLQLIAKSPDDLLRCLHNLERLAQTDERAHFKNIIAIDLNFGCPSSAIRREGAGPVLLHRKTRMTQLLETLSKWKKDTALPIGAVGCKIRLGDNALEQQQKIYLRVIEAANSAGIDYMTVHARHARQRSSEPPTWSAIDEIKALASIPIIGNGDIKCLNHAEQLHEESKCDGVMLARAAMRNPWIFRDFLSASDVRNPWIFRDFLSASDDTEDSDSNNDSEGGIKTNVDKNGTNDAGYWPSVEEVIEAREAYLKTAEKYKTKEKFVAFHKLNFERLLKIAQGGDRNVPMTKAPTSHLDP